MPRQSDFAGRSAPLQAPGVAIGLAAARIFVGGKFLVSGISKWGWLSSRQLREQVKTYIFMEHGTNLSHYGDLLAKYVVPHSQLLTKIVVFGEISVGILLVLGLFTRIGALAALFLSFNYLLGQWMMGTQWQDVHEAFVVLEVALLMAGAGRAYGADVRLARRWPRCPLW